MQFEHRYSLQQLWRIVSSVAEVGVKEARCEQKQHTQRYAYSETNGKIVTAAVL